MIARYSRPEMQRIWEPENKFSIWLDIEILACEAYEKLGQIPSEALANIKKGASFSVERIDEIERVVHHDVIAFLTAVGENIGEDARFMHLGMTSSDVLDTALAVQLKQAAELILDDLNKLLEAVKEKALQYKDTLMIGRTHGIHAEPITFGLKMALWYEELRRHRKRIESARAGIAVGKLSGAVGTYATLPIEVETYVCERLGLSPAPIATQVVQRDRHAEFFSSLALLGSSLEKFAVEIRHLQRTEVREAQEYFAKGQKGSSAMPHKKNPILSENLSGLARLLRSYALAGMENIPLWHERDISHSSVERVIGPDSTILADFMLHRITSLISNLLVYPERMKENLLSSRGLLFSQQLLLKLVKQGMSREEAYRIVQEHAMKVWEGRESLKERVLADPRIMAKLSAETVEDVFRHEHFVRHRDQIFKRVFG